MPPILDALPYPHHQRDAQLLHVTLTQLHPTSQGAVLLAQQAGLDSGMIDPGQPPYFVWKAILEQAAAAGLTRHLVQLVQDRLNPNSPRRPFLAGLLANHPVVTDEEPRGADGEPRFLRDSDAVSEPEALLYYDDLTIQIGRVPGLITTLERLVQLAPAVCRLTVDINAAGKKGTGFRIGSDLLLTNWHVFHSLSTGARATAVTAEFGYEDDGSGGALGATLVPCDVGTIVTDRANDWAVIRAREPLKDAWPVIKLSEAAPPVTGSPAYIIQHPGGDRKRLGFVRNQIASFDDQVVHYLTDTQEGSSGAPVFDAQGRLLALHHAGGRPQQVVGKPPVKKNEGVRIACVVDGLKKAGVAFA
jgi:hypothetical protein